MNSSHSRHLGGFEPSWPFPRAQCPLSFGPQPATNHCSAVASLPEKEKESGSRDKAGAAGADAIVVDRTMRTQFGTETPGGERVKPQRSETLAQILSNPTHLSSPLLTPPSPAFILCYDPNWRCIELYRVCMCWRVLNVRESQSENNRLLEQIKLFQF